MFASIRFLDHRLRCVCGVRLQGGINSSSQVKDYTVELACAGMQFKPEAYEFWEQYYNGKRDRFYKVEGPELDKPDQPLVKVRQSGQVGQ